jgi:hypothetical protein
MFKVMEQMAVTGPPRPKPLRNEREIEKRFGEQEKSRPDCGTSVFWYAEVPPDHIRIALARRRPVDALADGIGMGDDAASWVTFDHPIDRFTGQLSTPVTPEQADADAAIGEPCLSSGCRPVSNDKNPRAGAQRDKTARGRQGNLMVVRRGTRRFRGPRRKSLVYDPT